MSFPVLHFVPSGELSDITLEGITTENVNTTVTESKAIPGSPAEGDLVLVMGSCDNASGANITAPDDGSSDYTEILLDNNALPDCGAWYKIMGPTPDTNVNITGFGSGSSNPTPFIIATFRGVRSSNPLDVTSQKATNTSGDPDPPSITTATDKCAIISCGFIDDDNISSCTQSGGADVTFLAAGSSAGNTSSSMFGWQIQTTAGAVNPSAFVTDGDDDWVAFSIALRPSN